MINIENFTKSFGGQILFEKISLTINNHERVGLVGRNGHGKTTLLKILAGDEKADEGKVISSKNHRTGYVRQQLVFTEESVLKECMKGVPSDLEGDEWKAEKVLSGLGFSKVDMAMPPGKFSGGFQVRLNLAKILVSEPDLLLLDEPTNYLDISAIRWIKGFLNSWPHELLLVTHDRSFMDKVVTHVAGIHRRKLRKIAGNTKKYYDQIARDEEVYEKTRQNDEKRQKEMELFITRFRAKARLANMVQSRVKTLAKLEKKNKLDQIKNLDFSFRYLPFSAKTLMRVKNLSFGYDPDQVLVSGLSFTINAGDRILVVGKNGKGKTTLLKVISGAMEALEGDISANPGVVHGFFEQTNIKRLDDSKTIMDEILYSHQEIDQQVARNLAGAMMFSGDQALKKISVLSGGEKSRVMLAKLLATPVNLLILDEPTNHLDLESCDALLAAINEYKGAVVMVTHNEMFLHALAKRLIVFQGEGARVFEGSYQEFLEKEGWDDEEKSKSCQSAVAAGKEIRKLSKKELRKKRSEIISARAKILNPIEKKIKKIEDKIQVLEAELEKFNIEMLAASQTGDGEKISDLAKAIHKSRQTIDGLYEELEKFLLKLESQACPFDKELAEFESRLG